MGFEAEVSEQQRNYEKHRSHQELPGFAMLPKPLLFRNHDCVNTKPGLINCSCFQREKKKKQRFSSRLSVFVLQHEAKFLDLTLATRVRSWFG